MSLGSPIEDAAQINAMQRAAKVPLMVAADLEPNLGRLEGGVFTHYMIDAGGATVFRNAMAIAATGRESDAYDVGKTIGREARAIASSRTLRQRWTSTTTNRIPSSTRARSARSHAAWPRCRPRS